MSLSAVQEDLVGGDVEGSMVKMPFSKNMLLTSLLLSGKSSNPKVAIILPSQLSFTNISVAPMQKLTVVKSLAVSGTNSFYLFEPIFGRSLCAV